MSKRGGEEGADGGLAKKQKKEDDEASDSEQSDVVLGPFEEATKHRNFKFIVEDKNFFVCPHFMADVSPFFDTLCLGQFAEGQKGEAELKEVTSDDVIEMLYVLGADRESDRKEIDIDNCIRMVVLADKWQINVLKKRCNAFLEKDLPTPRSLKSTMDMLVFCTKKGISGKPLQLVVSKLASFGTTILLGQKVHKLITDPSLCAAVFVAAKDMKPTIEDGGPATKHYTFPPSDEKCDSCTRYAYKCKTCQRRFCVFHQSDVCPKRIDGSVTVKNFGTATVDARFLE